MLGRQQAFGKAFLWRPFGVYATRIGIGLGFALRFTDGAYRQGKWIRSARYVEIKLLHRVRITTSEMRPVSQNQGRCGACIAGSGTLGH
jgi:hypothetical protein